MARIIYGVWDDQVHDNRSKNIFEIREAPGLDGFNAFNQGNPVKAFVGDRGFFVFEPGVNLTDALWQYMTKAAAESCGKCTPCRVGTSLIRDRLGDLRQGRADARSCADVLDDIAELAGQVRSTALCGLGKTCTNALLTALTHFRDVLTTEAGAPAPDQPGLTYVTSPCIEACPAKVNVPRYIDYIRDGKPSHSLGVILQKYPMAATCGRVCVRFCEQSCRRRFVDEPVSIKVLKRFVADHERHLARQWFSRDLVTSPKPDALKVAVIGAGPAGISCAYHLLLKGYPVDVFEARPEAGGMAARGIPSYRLPKDVLRSEIEIIENLGGHIRYNQRLGRDFSLGDLFDQGYKAVFLGLGCESGRLLGVPDEDPTLQGYEPGIDFLLRVHDHVEGGPTVDLNGATVMVVGGGNVAMDCVRSALRLGAQEVHLVYRRGRAEMPADHEEIEAAEKEGIIFHFLTNPTRVVSENGQVTGVELINMRLSEPDAKGRRSVVAETGTEHVVPCDLLIPAIGQQLDASSLSPGDGVNIDKWGCVETDASSLGTARPGVFAGGDCVSGPSTLIQAMANGLKAARSIDDYLTCGRVRFFPRSRMRRIVNDFKALSKDWDDVPIKPEYRIQAGELDPEQRKAMFDEVEKPISQEEAYREAGRCLRCYRIYSVITESPIPHGAS